MYCRVRERWKISGGATARHGLWTILEAVVNRGDEKEESASHGIRSLAFLRPLLCCGWSLVLKPSFPLVKMEMKHLLEPQTRSTSQITRNLYQCVKWTVISRNSQWNGLTWSRVRIMKYTVCPLGTPGLPFVTPRQLIPFPKEKDHDGVSQQLKMPPFHHGPTNWQSARQKMRGPVELHCPPCHSPCAALCIDSHVLHTACLQHPAS